MEGGVQIRCGAVRHLCQPQPPELSGLLAFHFQPQAPADEGLRPCGPLARVS